MNTLNIPTSPVEQAPVSAVETPLFEIPVQSSGIGNYRPPIKWLDLEQDSENSSDPSCDDDPKTKNNRTATGAYLLNSATSTTWQGLQQLQTTGARTLARLLFGIVVVATLFITVTVLNKVRTLNNQQLQMNTQLNDLPTYNNLIDLLTPSVAPVTEAVETESSGWWWS